MNQKSFHHNISIGVEFLTNLKIKKSICYFQFSGLEFGVSLENLDSNFHLMSIKKIPKRWRRYE